MRSRWTMTGKPRYADEGWNMEGKKFYTKVLEAVKGVNFEELEWVELWEEFWEAERSNLIKDEEKGWGRQREDVEEKPDI